LNVNYAIHNASKLVICLIFSTLMTCHLLHKYMHVPSTPPKQCVDLLADDLLITGFNQSIN